MEQWITLLNDLPLKLVTPLLIIIMASVLAHADQPKSSDWLGRCALGVDCVFLLGDSLSKNNKQYYFTVISFFCFKLNELQRRPSKPLFADILNYSDACIEPRLSLSMFWSLFLVRA